ncbi:MAG: ribulose-phosphate 3-epimerase [Acidobacteriota bacterium]
MSVLIAPSILAADFAALGEDIAAAERGGADLIHLDVMDGHFVPNLTLGPPVVRAIKRVATVPLDVHLMITDPDRFIEAFAEAGAAMISVHVEVLPHLHRTVHAIKALGVKAGVVINPATPVGAIELIAGDVDYVLVMSVNPGFSGQRFIPSSEAKIRAVRALLDREGNPAPVEIDGGIDLRTVGPVVAAGARIVVAGAAIFSPTGQAGRDPEGATRQLKAAALAAVNTLSPR